MRISLPTLEETAALGQGIAEAIENNPLVPVFFYGDMGMGKTTLIRALASRLPGGENAEISSPSFTLCNIYPTNPPVAHFDLYRQENGAADESLLDFLDGERHVVLVEWAERLPVYALPPVRLACEISAEGDGRAARFTAYGPEAEAFLAELHMKHRSHSVFSR